MARTGYLADPIFLQHDTGPHPERADRLRAIHARLEQTGLLKDLTPLKATPAPRSALEAVHPAEHLDAIEAACTRGGGHLDPDTVVSPHSFQAAVMASGGALGAADRIMAGELDNAFLAVRPPGHHATAGQAMGFCLINHVAVLARYLQHHHGLERILIVDFDVHHGNGTQDIFYDDDTVMYISTHQSPAYPGSGARDERGAGKGVGFTHNFPLSPGAGDEEIRRIFNDQVLMEALDFMPDFVVISAGFDAHARDPLAHLKFSSGIYGEITQVLQVVAVNHCEGRIISLLEGGYDLIGLAEGVEEHIRALRHWAPEV